MGDQLQNARVEVEGVLNRLHDALGVSSDAQLARKLHVSSGTVSSWRARGTVPYDAVANLAGGGGLSLDWLLLGRGSKMADGAAGGPSAPTESPQEPRVALVRVPFYDIAASAGGGAEVVAEDLVDYRLYPADYLRRRGLNAKELVEFSVRGDSMAPELWPGDSVLVDRRAKKGPEDIYAVRVDSVLYVKYVRFEPDRWVLRSVSPAYSDSEVRLSDYTSTDTEVIGRVVRISRDR